MVCAVAEPVLDKCLMTEHVTGLAYFLCALGPLLGTFNLAVGGLSGFFNPPGCSRHFRCLVNVLAMWEAAPTVTGTAEDLLWTFKAF